MTGCFARSCEGCSNCSYISQACSICSGCYLCLSASASMWRSFDTVIWSSLGRGAREGPKQNHQKLRNHSSLSPINERPESMKKGWKRKRKVRRRLRLTDRQNAIKRLHVRTSPSSIQEITTLQSLPALFMASAKALATDFTCRAPGQSSLLNRFRWEVGPIQPEHANWVVACVSVHMVRFASFSKSIYI